MDTVSHIHMRPVIPPGNLRANGGHHKPCHGAGQSVSCANARHQSRNAARSMTRKVPWLKFILPAVVMLDEQTTQPAMISRQDSSSGVHQEGNFVSKRHFPRAPILHSKK